MYVYLHQSKNVRLECKKDKGNDDLGRGWAATLKQNTTAVRLSTRWKSELVRAVDDDLYDD